MDKLIEKLAEALKKEFPFLNGPGTAPDAFQKAAAGIVKKMGLVEMTFQVMPGLNADPVSWKVFILSPVVEQ